VHNTTAGDVRMDVFVMKKKILDSVYMLVIVNLFGCLGLTHYGKSFAFIVVTRIR